MPEAIDAQALAKLDQLDPSGANGLVRRVLTTYRGSLARLRQQIVDGVATRNSAGLRLGAHTLKSSSASVGALQLSRLCEAVEQACRDEQLAGAAELVAQLQRELERVDEAVGRLLER